MLVTSADLSKKSRDAFRAAVRTFGIEESYIWSRAELEDLLVAPRNDHLLFAYFGFSLQVRRRSRQSQVAAQIALKRKLTRIVPLRSSSYHTILLRDPDAPDYPFIHDFGVFAKRPRWKYYECSGHFPPGYLQVVLRQTIGWADPEKGTWDIPNVRPFLPANHKLHDIPEDLWKREQDELERLTNSVPEDRRATIKVYGYVPYERIIAIDEIGDAYNEGAHVLAQFDPEFAFFDPEMFTVTRVRGNYIPDVRLEDQNRIEFFPWPKSP